MVTKAGEIVVENDVAENDIRGPADNDDSDGEAKYQAKKVTMERLARQGFSNDAR